MNGRAIFLLALGHFLIDFCQGVVPALVPFLVEGRHFSYMVAASLVFAISATSSVVQPLFGHLADRLALSWLLPGEHPSGGDELGPGGASGERRGGFGGVWPVRPGSGGLPSGSRPQGPPRQRRSPDDRHELVFGGRWTGVCPGSSGHQGRGRHLGNRGLALSPGTDRDHRRPAHPNDRLGAREVPKSPRSRSDSEAVVTIGGRSEFSAGPRFAALSCSTD